MVRVRLSRGGGKKRPYYHIVVVDQKSKRDGKCIERIGSYDPNLENERRITLKQDRLDYWINLGAQMSERVKLLRKYTQDPDNLEKRQKVKSSLLEKNKARRLKAKEAEAAPAEEKAEAAPAEEKAEAAPAEEKAEAAPAEEKAEAAPAEEKAEAAPAEEKAEAAPAEEKADTDQQDQQKKLNLLILGLFHEKRLYCYHRKDTSHTWH